jgi:hypothetical protein
LETLTANLAGKPRHEDWNGRQYLVVPLTMLVPGVLSGSKGPLLYPADEVRKSPDDWNHIPIVVYHPMKDGKPVSARSPSILSKYGVGFVFHSRTDSKGVLKGEGWLDVEATRRVDKSVLDSVQLGKPLELSTGLFVDDEPAPEGAIFNDHRGTRKYVGIARNYKPDHLAILPSGKGACSLADGCGVLINEAAMEAYQVIINELEVEALSLYFPDLDLDLLTANKFNPNQPRDKAGRFATVAAATKKVEKAQGRVAKAQAALEKAKATLKVEKSGLLVAKKGLSEAKAREKAKSPAATRAIGKAKASTGTALGGRAAKPTTPSGSKPATVSKPATSAASKPAASPGVRTGKGSKVAQSIVGAINGGASNLKEAFNAVKKDHPGTTLGEFHDHVKALHESGHIKAQSYNEGLARLPSHEHALYHKNSVLYDVTAGPNNAPVKSPVEHKSLPKGLTDKLTTFIADAQAKNSFDQPTIARAHQHLKQFAPHITEGQTHDVIRKAQAEGKVQTGAYTQAPSTISASEKPLYMDREIKNYLDLGRNASKSSGASPATPASLRAGKPGKSGKSVDEHHAETEALTRSPMSHQAASKAVDSHIAGLNKSLNKAQTHELGQKLGLTHPKSATKKSVLDGIRAHIHARRGAHH